MNCFSTRAVLAMLALTLAQAAAAQNISFAASEHYSMGQPAGLNTVVVADVNADGRPDLLTANSYDNTAGVLLNMGNGIFPATATVYPTGGTGAAGIAVTDTNGDGHLDLVTANPGSNNVSVLKGNSTGVFQAPVLYSTGSASQPADVAVADLNGDGRPDLLTPNASSHQVGILLGTASGTFQPVMQYAVNSATGPTRLAVADVNSDGWQDVLTANGNTVALLPGNGNGTLQAPTAVSIITTAVHSLAIADVDRDNRPDLLLVDGASQVGVMPGNGNGTFQAGRSYSTNNTSNAGLSPIRVVAADINRDGFPELVTANVGGTSSNLSGSSSISILSGSSSGFQPAVIYSIGGRYNPVDVAVADVNADGRPDLLCAHYQANWMVVFLSTTPLPTRATLPGATASLAPNPAGAATTLHMAGLPTAVARVQATVLDATGREVARHLLPTRAGSIHAELPTAGLAPGLYVVRLLGYDGQGTLSGEAAAQRLSVQ